MLKNYKYNQRLITGGGRNSHQQEYDLIHAFLETDNENIMFEYETLDEAVSARQCIVNYAKKMRINITATQREKFVYALRKH